MAGYRVELTRSAARDLKALGPDAGLRLLAAIDSLSTAPRPRQSRKLTGTTSSYRLRVGRHRVLYEILDRERLVTVFAAGDRRDVYRRRR